MSSWFEIAANYEELQTELTNTISGIDCIEQFLVKFISAEQNYMQQLTGVMDQFSKDIISAFFKNSPATQGLVDKISKNLESFKNKNELF